MADNTYSLEEAASILGVSPEELDRMRQANQVPAVEEMGTWRFPSDAINAMAQTGSLPPGPDVNVAASSEFELEPIQVDTDLGLAAGEQPHALDTNLGPEPGSGSESGSKQNILDVSVGTDSDSVFGDFSDSIFPEDNAPRKDTGPGILSPAADAGAGSPLAPTLDYQEQGDILGPATPEGPALLPEPAAVPPSDAILPGVSPTSQSQPGLVEPTIDLDMGSEPGLSSSSDFSLEVDAEGVPLSSVADEPLPAPAPPPTGALSGPQLAPLETPDILPSEDSLDFGAPPAPGASQVQLGDSPAGGPAALSPTMPRMQAPGDQDVRLGVETGSFEFSLNVDSSQKLQEQAATGAAAPGLSEAPGADSDVRLDFDPTLTSDDDSLIGVGDRPDSDVRLEPVSGTKPDADLPELSKTEQIDLDAELRQAEEASQARRTTGAAQGRSTKAPPGLGPTPGALKTRAAAPSVPTMLPPAGSPFELSMEDLELSAGSLGASAGGAPSDSSGSADMGVPSAGGSEFELTLAPEDQSPLNLGDDEGVELGALPGKSDSPSSNRAELSGIHKQAPMDSAMDDGSDQVDFELTIDEDPGAGPKTIKGKLTDSDSEFELTLDEGGSSKSLPKVKTNVTGDQKDIFESTEFDLQAPGLEEESASQAVAINEPDTDLESSDFDLAIDESADTGSQVMEVDSGSVEASVESSTADELSVADSMLDQELVSGAEEAPAEEEEEAVPTVPAAQAEWGLVPLLMLIPCVLVMFLGLLMSYELLHNMWGYHQATQPSGLLVESFANLFKDEGSN